MVSLKGTQTEKNLLIAFAGESQARNRYTFYASAAKKEGYQAISKIFLETADQEKEHASRLFKFLEGGDLEITASFPAGKIGTTLENLQAAAYGEHEENTEMYPKFAQIAAQEGFPAIAEILKNIGLAERYHVFVRWPKQSKMAHCSNRIISLCGVAQIAVCGISEQRHQRYVPHACTNRGISSAKGQHLAVTRTKASVNTLSSKTKTKIPHLGDFL